MATFNYTGSQANVQTGATSYDVQPSRTIERAVEGMLRAGLSGMQYKQEVNEADFRRRQVDQRNTIAQFQADYDGASYEQRKEMQRELSALVVDPYQGDNRWDRELQATGISYMERVNSAIAEQGRKIEHTDAITSQNLAYIDAQRAMDETQDLATMSKIASDYMAKNVTPYEGIEDEYAQDLYNKGLERFTNLDERFRKTRTARADQTITEKALTAVQADVMAHGHITPERYDEIKATLARRSDFLNNKSQILTQLDNTILTAMRGVFNNPNVEQNEANANQYLANVEALVAKSPYMVGTPAYNDAISFANTMKNAAFRAEVNDLQATLRDGSVSQKLFDTRVDDLLARNIITEEEASNYKYQKAQVRETTAQRSIVMPLVQNGDVEGLTKLIKSGEVSGSIVATSIGDTLDMMHAQLIQSDPNNVAGANAYILDEFKKYQDAGIAPSKIPAIDATLKLPRSGEQLTDEQLYAYVATYEAAKDAGYYGASSSQVTSDYLAIDTMMKMGIPNIGEKLYNAKQNPIRISDKDVTEAMSNALDSDSGWITDGLNPHNLATVRSTVLPMVRSLMKAGVDPDDVEDMVSRGMETLYMRFDPSFSVFGDAKEVWIPRTEAIATEQQYRRAFNAVKTAIEQSSDNKLEYLGPLSPDNPNGDWIAVDNTGYVARIPYADISVGATTGRLPQ